MDGSHDNKWFVYMNDHHEGPFSMATLQAKLQSGEFNRTQYVWREGMSDWQPVSQVRELDSLFTPPAAPGSVAPPSDQGPVFDGKLSDIRDSEKGEPSFNITIDSGSVLTANEKEAENQRTIETLQEDHFNKIVINSSEVLTESFHPVPNMAEQAPPRRSSGFLKIFLLIAIIVVSTFGLMSGAFNPLLKNSRFASTASFLQDLGRPPFTKLAQWIPQLQSWISPIPSLPGVPESEMKELYRLSRQSDPPGLA
ncbi:MAG: DUF4339 domain-containing protein, partial [Bdellovibrionales bacterium]|nr:DUF4339 domain-containing protein [Bdellovibrionales bacterium]